MHLSLLEWEEVPQGYVLGGAYDSVSYRVFSEESSEFLIIACLTFLMGHRHAAIRLGWEAHLRTDRTLNSALHRPPKS